jgi:hypothetical protein
MARPIPPVFNEPGNLDMPGFDLLALKKGNLVGLQDRINKAAARNRDIAQWLNRLRLAAVASPLIFLYAANGFYWR